MNNKYWVLTFVLFSAHAFSYNNRKCISELYQTFIPNQSGTLAFLSTTTIAPTSTGQYFSSTGSCSMVGFNEQQRVLFVAQTLENLKAESTQGNGDYLEAYAQLSGCSKAGQKHLPHVFKQNFMNIFETTQFIDTYESMSAVLELDPILKNECQIQG